MRISKWIFTVLLSIFIFSCNTTVDYPSTNDPLKAGREFIDACVKGNFDKASFYMLPDPENKQILNKVNNQYKQLDDRKKKQLSESSIVILDISYLSQTETIINFKYSFDGYARKIKVIAQPNGDCLVDFKYANNGNL